MKKKKKIIIIIVIISLVALLLIGGGTTAIVMSSRNVEEKHTELDINDNQSFSYDGQKQKPTINNLDDIDESKVVYSFKEKDNDPNGGTYISGVPTNAGTYYVKTTYQDSSKIITMTIEKAKLELEEALTPIYPNGEFFTTDNNPKDIEFKDPLLAVPAFITIIFMPLTYSITDGIGWGILSYVILQSIAYCVKFILYKAGKAEEAPKWNISIVCLVVAVLFLVYFFVPMNF